MSCDYCGKSGKETAQGSGHSGNQAMKAWGVGEGGQVLLHCPACGAFVSPEGNPPTCVRCGGEIALDVATQQEIATYLTEEGLIDEKHIVPLPGTLIEGNPHAALRSRVADFFQQQQEQGGQPQVGSVGTVMVQQVGYEEIEPITLNDLGPLEAQKNRQGENRWTRAQDLVDKMQPTKTPGVYSYGSYIIDLTTEGPRGQLGTCTCEDYDGRMGPAGERCKHVLAATERASRDGVKLRKTMAMVQQEVAEEDEPAATVRPQSYEEEVVTSIQKVTALTPEDLPMPSMSEAPPQELPRGYELTPQHQDALRYMAGGLHFGFTQVRARDPSMDGRAFGLYGPPGTGKNSAVRALAASLELPCVEFDLNKDSDIQELLGGTTLHAEEGGTQSEAEVGEVGRALKSGAIVVLNEINNAPASVQSALHGLVQDGRWRLHSIESRGEEHLVHPSSMLVLTWNPREGAEEMPEGALLSRLYSFDMGYPSEAEEQAMLTRWAERSGLSQDQGRLESTTKLIRGLRVLYDGGTLREPPSFRHIQKFYNILTTTGDVNLAARVLKSTISHVYGADQQWASVEPIIQRYFSEYEAQVEPAAVAF